METFKATFGEKCLLKCIFIWFLVINGIIIIIINISIIGFILRLKNIFHVLALLRLTEYERDNILHDILVLWLVYSLIHITFYNQSHSN